MQSENKWYTLSSFKLKVIALLLMTIDHIGYLLNSYMYYNAVANNIGTAFRYIGRLAMPLFAFMIVEGVIHTKSYKRYAIRLGVMSGFITIGLLAAWIIGRSDKPIVIFNQWVLNPNDFRVIAKEGNIFLDLLLGSFLVFALMNKNKMFKLLSLIPIVISILSFVAKMIELNNSNTEVYWFPTFLRLQYDWISVVLIGLFYVAKLTTKFYYHQQERITGLNADVWKESGQYQKMDNLISCGFLVIFSAIYFGLSYLFPNYNLAWNAGMQSCMAIAGAFLLLYNGTRGYNKKWFQIFSYWYYPLHLVLLAGIFIAIFG